MCGMTVRATWPIFLGLFAVGGQRLCVCMHVGNEEGEREARGRSLSGGIKALLQW